MRSGALSVTVTEPALLRHSTTHHSALCVLTVHFYVHSFLLHAQEHKSVQHRFFLRWYLDQHTIPGVLLHEETAGEKNTRREYAIVYR